MPIKDMIENKNSADLLKDAIESKDSDAFLNAIESAVDSKAEAVLMDSLHSFDAEILKARGARLLTSEETKYYNKLIEALKSPNYQDAIRKIDTVYPETVIDTIFDDLTTNHPLLSHLDIRSVNIKVKVLFAKSDNVKAIWGPLTGKITQEVAGEFSELDAYQLKLSAFMPISNAMLDLGPTYLDRFIRTILYEAIANGIEDAVINNLVSNTGPIGMKADLEKGTTNSGKTTYTAKTATAITDWLPATMGPILSKMAKTRNGNYRTVGNLFVVVNPSDYYTKVVPSLNILNASGTWVPVSYFPVTVVQSKYVSEGTAILGMDKRYMLGLGTAEAGKLEYSDEYQFVDDARTYRIKLYGNGQPKDNTSFEVLDISGLKALELLTVSVTNNNEVKVEQPASE